MQRRYYAWKKGVNLIGAVQHVGLLKQSVFHRTWCEFH